MRLALPLLFLLLRRALQLLFLLKRLSLLLLVAPYRGIAPRAAREVALGHQRRARVVSCRRPLPCRIVRRATRRARG